MMDCQQWRVIYESETIQIGNLNFNPLNPSEVKIEPHEYSITIIPQMSNLKIIEAKSISNYFAIPILPSFINTILNLSKTLHFQNIYSLERLRSLLIKCGAGPEGQGEQIKTRRALLSICFSRRWRQPQKTIYILMHNYVSQKNCKIRAYILNQRGLILQTFSNLDSSTYASTLSKFIMSHYGRVQTIVLVAPEAGIVDLDSFYLFRECEQQPSVILISYKTIKSLRLLQKYQQTNVSLFRVVDHNELVLARYGKQQLLVCYNQSVNYGQICQYLQRLHQILTREAYISSIFLAYDYYSDNFSQKSLFLRLFSFYFNFTCLQNLSQDNISVLHQRIMHSVADELERRFQEDQSKCEQEQAHTFTSNIRALYCPVCNKRSKIICKKCCMEFNRAFSLCESKCFQFFHKDRLSFAATIQQYKKYREYQMINCAKNSNQGKKYMVNNLKDEFTNGNNLSSDVASITQVISYKQVREKWVKPYEGLQNQLNLFNNNFAIGLISQLVLNKVNYMNRYAFDNSVIDQTISMIKQEACE